MEYLLVVHSPGQSGKPFRIDSAAVVVGSGSGAGIRLSSASLAERQGVFRFANERLVYVPMTSPRGTDLIRGGVARRIDLAIDCEVELQRGDRLAFGTGADQVSVEVLSGDPDEAHPEDIAHTDEAPSRETSIVAARSVRAVDSLEARIRQSPSDAIANLYAMTKRLLATRSLGDLATATAEQVFHAFPTSTHVTIFVPEESSPNRLRPAFTRQRRQAEDVGSEEHAVSRTLLDRALGEREAILFLDAPTIFGRSGSVRRSGIHSSILVPLFVTDRLVGVLQVDSRRKAGAFNERDLEILTVFGSQLAAVLDNARLRDQLEQAEAALRRENKALRRTLEDRGHLPVLIGESSIMKEVARQIEQAAREALPILIGGETGTGKDLVARIAHSLSSRCSGPFVPINCGAVPRELLESELFGHVKGAFTGAVSARAGLFANATGGTLFLDEVGDLPPEFQVKLLRVLEERRIRAVGSDRFQPVDVRIFSATNKDLDEEIAAGRFRSDLFYRLNVLRIDIPPLRERPEDIPVLAERFLSDYSTATGKTIHGFSTKAMAAMLVYPWPGNVREVRNEVERAAAATAAGGPVEREALSPRIRGKTAAEQPADGEGMLKEAVDAMERRMIEQALRRFGGNISRIAEHLGLSRPGLRQKMARFGLAKDIDG